MKAIGATILAAFICGYLTLCLLFYQGQWQLLLHPSRTNSAPATIDSAPFQTIRFGVDETATPQLTGWLIPTESAARFAAYTVLYLPGGDGSLAGSSHMLAALHSAGINVFAFDYRGYGDSAAIHPSQLRMTQDAASAWKYLTVSRALPSSKIVLFGDGLGAALAVQLAAAHPEAPAVVLQSPRPNPIQTVLADPRTSFLPVRVLFHEHFGIAAQVSSLKTPKLFILSTGFNDQSATAAELLQLTTIAASPKMISTISSADFGGPIYRQQIVRFLDEYLR